MSYFPSCTPAEVGICPDGISAFLSDLTRKGIELHSLMVIRHGRLCAEGYYAPYGPDYLHPIFSFSKSFTAAAIGFAEQEGLLSLDEKLIDFFPEYLPENPSPYLAEVTLHDLLIMGCGQEWESMDRGPTWIRSFLEDPFVHKPGTFYKYNTAGTNILAAILQKRTGLRVTEFLKPRLFDPLGITRYECTRIDDEQGTEMGGAGMRLRTEDMAKFTYFMLKNGEWEGKKLLQNWYSRAGRKQIETRGDSEGHVKEWALGYGYQCWMCHLPDSYRADGAFGQFGFVFPSLDTIIVMTAATEQTQSLIDSMYDHLIPAISDDVLFGEHVGKDLTPLLSGLSLPVLSGCYNPTGEARVNGISYRTTATSGEQGMSSLDRIIGGTGVFHIRDHTEIRRMSFVFDQNSVTWAVTDGDRMKLITAAMDSRFSHGSYDGIPYAACARWRDQYVLEMEIRRMDALSGVRLIFRFVDDDLFITADETLITQGMFGKVPKHLVPFVKES